MELFVQNDTVSLHHYRDDGTGDWDHSWSDSYSFSVKGVRLSKCPKYRNEIFGKTFDCEVGDVVHVLTIVYGTGDSFGSSSGNGEVMWVFKDYKLADAAKKKFENGKDDVTIKFQNDLGKITSLYNPSYGYFESLEEARVDTFIVQG